MQNAPLEVYTARQGYKLYFTVTQVPNQNKKIVFVEGGGTSGAITQGDVGATNGKYCFLKHVSRSYFFKECFQVIVEKPNPTCYNVKTV